MQRSLNRLGVVDARVRMWQAKGKDERTEVEVVAAEEAAS